MSRKIELFDIVVQECGHFYNAYAEYDINVNNGYNCDHPNQEDTEEVEGKKIGCCHCFTCPLGREAFEENFEDSTIDKQDYEYEESAYLVIDEE